MRVKVVSLNSETSWNEFKQDTFGEYLELNGMTVYSRQKHYKKPIV